MILDLWQAGGFLVASIAVTLAPGPDNLMILSLGLSRGRRAGFVFGLGCALGCLFHTALAVLGLGALIVASPEAFFAIQIVGGFYLIWLGIGLWRASSAESAKDSMPLAEREGQLWRLFGRGLIANAINPKVMVFFLAFLPQFVTAGQGGEVIQMAALGGLFTVQAVVLFGVIGWFSGTFGQWLRGMPGVANWLHKIAGTIFLGLGLRLILVR
ncbi:LysE family translocator [Magnetospirillum molischianum]|uniref:Putative threonine efflux protein n=1 Tax=Magnetospirillum molischianum DSM 120 TaxID=1150626 RepID=H8FXS6_MAGML|nr:LysE family translocator [Magnetospirillum molischianum]CCG43164.1 putative threonine efflux protein [Magnetospirillum molischianum DSM 120]